MARPRIGSSSPGAMTAVSAGRNAGADADRLLCAMRAARSPPAVTMRRHSPLAALSSPLPGATLKLRSPLSIDHSRSPVRWLCTRFQCPSCCAWHDARSRVGRRSARQAIRLALDRPRRACYRVEFALRCSSRNIDGPTAARTAAVFHSLLPQLGVARCARNFASACRDRAPVQATGIPFTHHQKAPRAGTGGAISA